MSARLVAYIRVSTSEQRLGAEAQRAAIAAWASRAGVEITSYHEDLNVRGKRPWQTRPGLVAALDAAQLEGARGLVVFKRDRLARRRAVVLDIELELRRRRLDLVSTAGEGTDAPLESQRVLQGGISDLISEVEVVQIGERTRAALAVLRREGRTYGKPPFGWRDEGGRLVMDFHEQAARAFIWRQKEAGRSLRAIVADLAREGFKNRNGQPLKLSTVVAVLDPKRELPPVL